MVVSRRMFAVGVLLGLVVAVPVQAQSPRQLNKARKLLEKIKGVDGTGSGLDADTLQGMTPADLRTLNPASVLQAVTQVDGTGSGLDADTVGQTPDELVASATNEVVISHQMGWLLQNGGRDRCRRSPTSSC